MEGVERGWSAIGEQICDGREGVVI